MKTKILMVCLGNICRSPLAEGILAEKLPSSKFKIDSAGTAGYHIGRKPDTRSIQVAQKNGIDITYQRGRQFNINDFNEFDFIYAMDFSVYKDIITLAPDENAKSKVKMILNEVFPGENMDVPDPYYGSDFGFESVYKMLDQACEVIANKLNPKND
jgi:protein-tyrosine phosphatase